MSQGTFSDTLIRLNAFKRIFVFRTKNRLFAKRQVHAFWPKRSKCSNGHFLLVYVPRDLGVSMNALGNH